MSSAYMSVLVNGSPSCELMERGLRQGDPVSPFLDLLVAEGLGILTSRAIELNLFSHVVMGTNKIKISQL